MGNRITEEIMPSLQGVIPALLASASADGIPNATTISQVYYVDETHVALSRQFFNKTVRNIEENPIVCVMLTCPLTYTTRRFLLKFVASRKEGDVFESMSLQLQVLAGRYEKAASFSLQSADIFEILSIQNVYP